MDLHPVVDTAIAASHVWEAALPFTAETRDGKGCGCVRMLDLLGWSMSNPDQIFHSSLVPPQVA